MDIEKIILKKFELVNNAFFEEENNIRFLRVEVEIKDLKKLLDYSKKINDFIDQNDQSNKKYYLDIYSSGTEVQIDKNHLEQYIGKNIFVRLEKPIKKMQNFEGELLEDSEKYILIKWNAKGQFRKQIFYKDNIKSINLSAKVKK